MEYSPDFNVMQYCNGIEWVAMGPVGGADITAGLTGHWKMDDTSGTIVDSAGSLDGSWVGGFDSSDSVSGVLGTALDFNGSSEWINLPSNSLGQNLGAFTIALWMKADGLASVVGYGQLFGLSENADAAASRAYMTYNTTDQINLGADAPDNTSQYSATTDMTFAADTWYHIVGVADIANDTLKIYVNGSAVSVTYPGGAPAWTNAATDNTTSANGVIGGEENNVGWGDFAGKLDDVRFYNRVLTDREIMQLYYYGLSGGLGDVDNACANPTGVEGQMLYNIDHTVMQYCNGERWVGIGK